MHSIPRCMSSAGTSLYRCIQKPYSTWVCMYKTTCSILWVRRAFPIHRERRLIGIQLLEKYKENVDVSRGLLVAGIGKITWSFILVNIKAITWQNKPITFQVVVSLSIRSFLIMGPTYTDRSRFPIHLLLQLQLFLSPFFVVAINHCYHKKRR